MSLKFDIEEIHKSYMQGLKEEFDIEDIENRYKEKRERLEKDAKIKNFIPILVYNSIKQEFYWRK
mgnify:CR=1 FL=1